MVGTIRQLCLLGNPAAPPIIAMNMIDFAMSLTQVADPVRSWHHTTFILDVNVRAEF